VLAAAGTIWAQAPGAPGRTTKKTGKQAERDESLWRKPVLPPPPSQDPWPTDPQSGAPRRPCPQDPRRSMPLELLGEPVGLGDQLLGGAVWSAGDRQYRDMIVCDLESIAGVPVGLAFLEELRDALASRSRRVTIETKEWYALGPHTRAGGGGVEAWLAASDSSLARVYRAEPRRVPFTNYFFTLESPIDPARYPSVQRGRGVGSTVFYSPTQFPLAPLISKRQTPGYVAFLHELLHAWHYAIGKGNLSPRVNAAGNVDPTWVSEEEYNTIPVTDWKFSENAYRQERGLPLRNCVPASCF
jgi:hypothetical protein